MAHNSQHGNKFIQFAPWKEEQNIEEIEKKLIQLAQTASKSGILNIILPIKSKKTYWLMDQNMGKQFTPHVTTNLFTGYLRFE